MCLNDVKIRKLKNLEKDYILLEKWCSQKEIYNHFEQRVLSYEEIKNKYYPRTFDDSLVPVYMIEFNEEPVGIIQYKVLSKEDKILYKIKENYNCYEIDVFIGELEYHNMKIGQKSINILQKMLFKKGADKLIMCPLKDNISAIHCYLKCGFVIKDEFETLNTIGEMKQYVLMIKDSN